MRVLSLVIVASIIFVLGYEAYSLYRENKVLEASVQELIAKNRAVKDENQKLDGDLIYYSDKENLAKELKARFDYKRPGETLYKIP